MSRMTKPRQFLVFFNENACRTNHPQIPCVFSGKMRPAFNVTVNLHDSPANSPRFRIFFLGKGVPQQPFLTLCVFSSKTRLGFNAIVNLHVMRPTASTCLIFFHRKCASQESCRIPWLHFPCVFSSKVNLLGSQVIVNSHVMRPTVLGLLLFFQGKRASQEGFPEVTAIANVHSCPSQEEGQMLTKDIVSKGDVRLFDFQVFT